MRQTAGAIRSELEDTRAEIKKGVFEMPLEAKESTSAIRRAVSEQINALKELSDIVARSGRNTDVSEGRSSARPAASPQPQPQPARAAGPQPRRQPAPQPQAPQPRAPQPVADIARPSEAPVRPRDGAQRNAQGGWVRDLLTGASREDDAQPAAVAVADAGPRPSIKPRSPGQVVESLNSLSVDIARAIDHDASIELWDRYRRGERDVFTRRLYTLKGQQTFDEIHRKYQSDAEFRSAVDRYCEDFEKLLKDVAKNDRDNVMQQTYLTSDTGKVYTMLAHAGGRLR
jgi:hypothetical protein